MLSNLIGINGMPMIRKTGLAINTCASPRGKTRNLVLAFITLHVLMSFHMNHIFKNHSSYSIEYKHLIINMIFLPLEHISEKQWIHRIMKLKTRGQERRRRRRHKVAAVLE